MSLIAYAMRTAKEYYDEKIYAHAARVAQYVAENNLIPNDKMDDCIALAWIHNLREDTDWSSGGLSKHFNDCLDWLTKPKDMDYIEYIKRIKKWADTRQEAYWVKLADMKDHLAQNRNINGQAEGEVFSSVVVFIIENYRRRLYGYK